MSRLFAALVFLHFLVVAVAAVPNETKTAPTGPVVRNLGQDYFLVQCNAGLPQPDEIVIISRGGKEKGAAKVMRIQGSLCSVKIVSGSAAPGDCVSLRRTVALSDRGPELPSAGVTSLGPARSPNSDSPRQGRPESYWNSINGGRVMDLNSGKVFP